jgi:2-polyprenyl-6-methoxyphenol hydroxylase-like FAD-dependent oxidoreductase
VDGVVVRDRHGAARRVRAGFVVGADGVRSRVARSVEAGVVERRPAGGTTQYVYATGFAADAFEVHFDDGFFAGVFPTHGNHASVWVCTPPEVAAPVSRGGLPDFGKLLRDHAPSLESRVRGAAVSPLRSATDLPNHVRRAAGPGWALVGDAGYHRDALTGHGLSDAYRDAELLATALHHALRGDLDSDAALAGYQRRRDCALRRVFDLTVALAAYPAVPEFVSLQKQLARVLDAEALELAARRPLLPDDKHELATA